MLEIIQDMPDNIVAVRASGQISGKDYDDALVPAVASSVKRHWKIRENDEEGCHDGKGNEDDE